MAIKHTWQSIQAEISRKISDRIWLPGETVPKEIDLAKHFGCSRGTINRAMRELAEVGLVDRKKKAGTKVALNPVRKAKLDIPVIRLDVEGRGAEYRHIMIDQKIAPAPAVIASKLGIEIKTQMLKLRAMHFADNQPFLLEDRWVNHTAVPAILDVDFSTISANEWLVQNAPLTTGNISFLATNATELEAELLDTNTGVALFVISRCTWIGKSPVTSVRLTYAPGFQMHTNL